MRTSRQRMLAPHDVLFRATDLEDPRLADHRVDRLLGWAQLARGGLEVHDVPGTHHAVVSEANLARVADTLRPHLVDAHNRSAASQATQ
jgi:thioesterase domain-containing protein